MGKSDPAEQTVAFLIKAFLTQRLA